MRITDESRLERVKKATIQIIVKKGYHGTTISKVASSAGVSDGYLYRHYKNKAELVQELFIENKRDFHKTILNFIENNENIHDFLEQSCSYIHTTVVTKPEIIKFYSLLQHDYSFAFPDIIKKEVKLIGQNILEKGLKTGEINKDTRVEEILLSFFGFQAKLVDMVEKGIISKEYFENQARNRIINMCLKVWR